MEKLVWEYDDDAKQQEEESIVTIRPRNNMHNAKREGIGETRRRKGSEKEKRRWRRNGLESI